MSYCQWAPCVCMCVCECVCLFVCVCASKCCQLLQSGKRKRNETVAGIAINHLCSSLALTHPDTHTHPNTHTHTHSCHTNAHTRSAVMLCTKWHKSTYTPTQTEREREGGERGGERGRRTVGDVPAVICRTCERLPKEYAAEKLQTYALRFAASSCHQCRAVPPSPHFPLCPHLALRVHVIASCVL